MQTAVVVVYFLHRNYLLRKIPLNTHIYSIDQHAIGKTRNLAIANTLQSASHYSPSCWRWQYRWRMTSDGLRTLYAQYFRYNETIYYSAVLSMLLQDICPSVCPSHAGIVSKWTNISNFFSPSCRHTILQFSPAKPVTYWPVV